MFTHFFIPSGLTFLASLAKLPDGANETALLSGLPKSIWPRMAYLLCLPDLAIVCACLEALRCLTNFGAVTCGYIWSACCDDNAVLGDTAGAPRMLLRPLLALLTLEGQSMGSQSLHRIRVCIGVCVCM